MCVEVCVRVDWRMRGDLLEQVGEHQGGDGPHHGHLHAETEKKYQMGVLDDLGGYRL